MAVAAHAASATPQQVAELELQGFKYAEVAQFDLDRLALDRRIQVRETRNLSPQSLVQQYSIQLKQSVFPPIIVSADDWIADGNTRIRAARLAKLRFFPAIVIRENYGDASPKDQLRFEVLAATLNNQSGQRQSPKELRELVQKLVAENYRVEQIARIAAAKSSLINQVRYEVAAHDRLAHVGLQNGSVRAMGVSLRALGRPIVVALNDAPFKAIAELTMDAGLNAREIFDFAKQVKSTGSDASGLKLLAELREEFSDRIAKHRREAGPSKPPEARMLRQHLGFIHKFESEAGALVETNPSSVQAHSAAIERAVAILQHVLELQAIRDREAV